MKLIDYLNENSIYADNPDDPLDPEVLVSGVGRYNLSQLEANVNRKIKDLASIVTQAKDEDDWNDIKRKLNHAAMHEMINSIISAKKELNKRKEFASRNK